MNELNEIMTKTAVASLYWSLDVECPHCGGDNDLLKIDHDNNLSHYIFTNRWHKINGFEVECVHCKEEFKVEKVEY
jgi:glutaredoxin